MEALIAIFVGAASLAWWRRLRRKPLSLDDFLDGDAQVVMHVAEHERRTRAQPTLTAAHVLCGLLQDDAIAAAIEATGGHPGALEDRVQAALDGVADHQVVITADAQAMLAHAYGSAQQHGREITAIDLWAYALRTDAAALLDTSEVDGVRVLHLLVHRMPLPELHDPGTSDVHVVIRNDDYTTREFVTDLLVRVFELPEAEARAKMLATHHEGKAVVGRLPTVIAHARIRQARELARAERFPLWIGDEPA